MIQFDRKPWCLRLLNFMVVTSYLSKVPYLNSLDLDRYLKKMCVCLTYMTNFRIFQFNRKHSKIVHTQWSMVTGFLNMATCGLFVRQWYQLGFAKYLLCYFVDGDTKTKTTMPLKNDVSPLHLFL